MEQVHVTGPPQPERRRFGHVPKVFFGRNGVRVVECSLAENGMISLMKIIETLGNVDAHQHLSANVPDLPPGPVRVAVLPPLEVAADSAWTHAIAKEWSEELADPREDLYTLEDGYPVDIAR